MTILNFDKVLTEMSGVELKGTDKNPLTMKSVIVDCILAPDPEQKGGNGEESLKCYMLAQKVFAGGDIDFTPEEIVKIKALVGKFAFKLVCGQIYTHIAETTTSKKKG